MKFLWKNICNELVIYWNHNTIVTSRTLKIRLHYPVSWYIVLAYLCNFLILIHSIWDAIYETINFWHQVDRLQFHIVFIAAFFCYDRRGALGLFTIISLVSSEKYYGNGKILWKTDDQSISTPFEYN